MSLTQVGVVGVGFSSRVVLVGSVGAVLAVSSGTALTLLATHDDQPVALPAFAPSAGVRDDVVPVAAAPIVAGPPVTGGQIAALAGAPARDRASSIVTAAEEAERARAAAAAAAAVPTAEPEDGYDDWDRLRERIGDACDDGRLRGAICRGD